MVAETLGFALVDTGLFYRAVTVEARRRGIAAGDVPGLTTMLGDLRIEINTSPSAGGWRAPPPLERGGGGAAPGGAPLPGFCRRALAHFRDPRGAPDVDRAAAPRGPRRRRDPGPRHRNSDLSRRGREILLHGAGRGAGRPAPPRVGSSARQRDAGRAARAGNRRPRPRRSGTRSRAVAAGNRCYNRRD